MSIHPHSYQFLDAPAADSEIAERADKHLFDRTDKPADVLAKIPQIENRIANELLGAVIGHIAAALDPENLNALLSQEIARGDDMLIFRIAAEGKNRWMFEEDECVIQLAALARIDKAMLQRERIRVGDAVEIQEPDRVHLRRSGLVRLGAQFGFFRRLEPAHEIDQPLRGRVEKFFPGFDAGFARIEGRAALCKIEGIHREVRAKF